jgi:hypothetical protein
LSDICKEREALTKSGKDQGTCYKCGDYQKGINHNKECGNECVKRQFVHLDGSCEDCPNYDNPVLDPKSGYNTTCSEATCSIDYEYIEKDGSCQKCPDYKRAPGDSSKVDNCASDKCNTNEVNYKNGDQ